MDESPKSLPDYRALMGSLVVLALLFLLIDPVAKPWAYGIVIWRAGFWLVLFQALRSLRLGARGRLVSYLTLGSIVATGVLGLVLDSSDEPRGQLETVVTAANGGLSLLMLGGAAALILRSVLSDGRVDANRMWGGVCVYVMLGLIWALLYGLVDVFSVGSLVYLGNVPPGLGMLDLLGTAMQNSEGGLGPLSEHGGNKLGLRLYFSFVTLTTVGYGDVGPGNAVTQLLATSEALVGQLFLTVLLARLVALSVAHAMTPPSVGGLAAPAGAVGGAEAVGEPEARSAGSDAAEAADPDSDR